MINKFKFIFITSLFSMAFALAFTSTAFASISVTCAARCRYTCEYSIFGSGSAAERERKIQQCCSQAFANTPGIENVPCSNLE